jgi:hypothetical protein
MKVIAKVERALERLFRFNPVREGRQREPLEIRRSILRDLVDQVQPKGGGEFVFPYRSVRITAFAADETRSQQLRAVLEDASFLRELNSELAASGCAQTTVDLQITVETAASESEYAIEYPIRETSLPPVEIPRPPARLLVRAGAANTQVLEIVSNTVLLGRMLEVVELNTGRTRHNDLAFDESELTVSRKHARIAYDSASGQFRLFDELESSEGTYIARAGGQDIECDARRGVRLRSGDEIRLGRARIIFDILQ